MARAVVLAEQWGQPGLAELLRQVRKGEIALVAISGRRERLSAAELNSSKLPTLVLIGDDDVAPTGPSAWLGARGVAEWALAAVVHAAGASAETYGQAVKAARLFGRAVLVETGTEHAAEWATLFREKPTLMIWPRGGVHPVAPVRSAMH